MEVGVPVANPGSADDGEHRACRLEEYLTDPAQQPDMSKWQSRLAFRLSN